MPGVKNVPEEYTGQEEIGQSINRVSKQKRDYGKNGKHRYCNDGEQIEKKDAVGLRVVGRMA